MSANLVEMHIPDWSDYRLLQVRFMVVFPSNGSPRLEQQPPPLHSPAIPGALPLKESVDVTIDGQAFPSMSAFESRVRLIAGDIDSRALVLPPRRAFLRNGAIEIENDGPNTPVAIDPMNAYGGISEGRFYPRNPFGSGFVLRGDPHLETIGIELPRLELVEDRLTPERIVANLDRWWEQPLPAFMGAVPMVCFSRFGALGIGVDRPIDPNACPREVARGELTMAEVTSPFEVKSFKPNRAWAQEAPWGQRLKRLDPGLEIAVEGCRPNGQSFRCRVPPAPPVVATVERVSIEPRVLPQHVRVRPDRDEVAISYGFDLELTRSFIPGVHPRIPIAIHLLSQARSFPTPDLIEMRRRL